MSADSRIQAITARIVERSKPYRETYLERLGHLLGDGRLFRIDRQLLLAD